MPKNILGAKLAGSAAIAALLFAGGVGLASAQTTTSTGTTVTPYTTTDTTGTGSTMTTGTPNASDTGAINPASSTGTTGTTGATGTTPGVPNTGAGGDAATNLAILAATGIIVVGGTVYLARKRNALG